MFRKALLASAAAIALCTAAHAQVIPPGASPVYQSATHADAATFMASTPAPATACATINTSTANGTVTIPAQAGMNIYITGVYIDIVAGDTTGTTGVAVMTWANVGNTNSGTAPVYSLATLAVATSTTGTPARQIAEVYSPPLKSAAAGTAVTLTPSAQLAHSVVCPRVTGYYAP